MRNKRSGFIWPLQPCSSSTALIYNKVRMQYFNDPVHNLLHLPPLAAKIYDTRQFQRLSDLKQLGLTYQVFRGASHNRCVCGL